MTEKCDCYGMNVYSNPCTHGLEIFAEIERPDTCYAFSMFVVWKGKRGGLYYAYDSGCSCPVPFEDYTSIETLERISGEAGLRSFLAALTSWRDWNPGVNIDNMRRKVREHMEKL